ncbi:HAD-IA family hydrolase [Novosphingobium sp. ZN18A2]|uniref:HAD-IA family hydrolase n=1 Tax=Novosphingobium sp. ZN18A2 TaxID=3079861 RepID=UPI0030D2F285
MHAVGLTGAAAMDWPRAIIFDVDGTLAETEEWHRKAFNEAFLTHGLDWHWDRACYRDHLKVTGGKERIRHFAGERSAAIDVAAIHAAKNAIYREYVAKGHIALRPGIADLVSHARKHGIRLAIATTTSRENAFGLLERAFGGAGLFDSVVTGEDVARKKPDPEAYRLVLSELGLPADSCLAVEDSHNGLLAASGAGIDCLLSPSQYCPVENVTTAWRVVNSFAEMPPGRLLARDMG